MKNPTIGKEVFVAPGAILIGDVRLGDHSSVWFGTVLRGDNDTITVGPRSNIQDGTVVHVDPDVPVSIGEGVTIGHRAIIHGCRIEDNVIIGMGAIVLNGAVIGSESIVGAGAVVPEGKVIPPRSLVLGVPGRVVRRLTDRDVERIRRNAAVYVAHARQYLAGRWPVYGTSRRG